MIRLCAQGGGSGRSYSLSVDFLVWAFSWCCPKGLVVYNKSEYCLDHAVIKLKLPKVGSNRREFNSDMPWFFFATHPPSIFNMRCC